MKDQKQRELLIQLFKTITSEDRIAQTSERQLKDLYVQIDPTIGEVQIFDESEQTLAVTTIYKWIDERATRPTEEMKEMLRAALQSLATEGFFTHPLFGRPLSIQLQEGDADQAEEILFVDEDLIRLDDPLLLGLDEDLDDFLSHLLGDSE